MVICVYRGSKTLKVPRDSKGRKYTMKAYYGLDSVYKLHRSKWFKFMPSWCEPSPLVTEFGLFEIWPETQWQDGMKAPELIATINLDVTIIEYNLGYDCVLTRQEIGSKVSQFIRTSDPANLHRLVRSPKGHSLLSADT